MTPEQLVSAEIMSTFAPRGRLYGKIWRRWMAKDTGGRRFRYLRATAKRGWLDAPYNPCRITDIPEAVN